MKIDKCKWLGHKWRIIYVGGRYGEKSVKFVGAYCRRCDLGRKELLNTIAQQDEQYYGTDNPKYWDGFDGESGRPEREVHSPHEAFDPHSTALSAIIKGVSLMGDGKTKAQIKEIDSPLDIEPYLNKIVKG